ncbi:MAG: DUF4064 domain-containing protein [Thermoplasmata archaeon]|nr:MAG: DUF4064 domain-containing protein [Thermoplasmata archaeon]
MAGNEKLVVGVIALIIGIVLLLFGAMAAITYFDGVPKVDDKKEIRDQYKDEGRDTTSLDKQIEDDEELLETKTQAMGICLPIGIILLIVGIVLIFLWNKDKKAAPQVSPPQQYQVPQQQYPPQQYPPQQYPPQQYPPQQYPPQQPPGY